MAFGEVWNLPSGHIGVEMKREGDYLQIARIVPNWPWPAPPHVYIASLCSPSDESVPDEVLGMLREVAC